MGLGNVMGLINDHNIPRLLQDLDFNLSLFCIIHGNYQVRIILPRVASGRQLAFHGSSMLRGYDSCLDVKEIIQRLSPLFSQIGWTYNQKFRRTLSGHQF